MTQLNGSIKLSDVKIYYPRCRVILKHYGLVSRETESMTVERACEVNRVDVDEVMERLAQADVESCFSNWSTND